jgi:hypothetical protein
LPGNSGNGQKGFHSGKAAEEVPRILFPPIPNIIVFLESIPPGNAQEWKEFQARRDQRPGPPGHQRAINPGDERSLTDSLRRG